MIRVATGLGGRHPDHGHRTRCVHSGPVHESSRLTLRMPHAAAPRMLQNTSRTTSFLSGETPPRKKTTRSISSKDCGRGRHAMRGVVRRPSRASERNHARPHPNPDHVTFLSLSRPRGPFRTSPRVTHRTSAQAMLAFERPRRPTRAQGHLQRALARCWW